MVGGLALSRLLTLYTTPVVHLYLDRVQTWLRRDRRVFGTRSGSARSVAPVAAE
jgi:hypothetical protein